jgi:hypothetical protein
MVAKITRLTHEIAIQLHLVADGCTICRSRSRRPVRKFLNTPSYVTLMWIRVKVVKWKLRAIHYEADASRDPVESRSVIGLEYCEWNTTSFWSCLVFTVPVHDGSFLDHHQLWWHRYSWEHCPYSTPIIHGDTILSALVYKHIKVA